ncbi:MAG TPA: PilZ domain-containing protein [Candidatus Acidoferrum sp.]|nr:PilZ domain-containing protein [Candidatus Acidoferrum sp.]
MPDAIGKTSRALSTAVAERAERRQGPRYGINADTEVEEPESETKISGRTADLGMGGCYVDSLTTFPAGTSVQVRISRGGHTFEADARVLYGKSGMGMGIAFLGMGQEEKALLEKWIQELSASSNPGVKRYLAPPIMDRDGGEIDVVSQLITLLLRKGILNQSECEHLRRKLERKPRE